MNLSFLDKWRKRTYPDPSVPLAESVSGSRVTQGFVRQEVNASLFRDLVEDHSRYSMDVARTTAASGRCFSNASWA